jgi:hypothetical protein
MYGTCTVTFIKTQREFWETFFQRNILDSLKPIKAKFWHFLTDKCPNIVIPEYQYDFFKLTIFISLGLILNLVIFGFFVGNLGSTVVRKFFSTINHDKKINLTREVLELATWYRSKSITNRLGILENGPMQKIASWASSPT